MSNANFSRIATSRRLSRISALVFLAFLISGCVTKSPSPIGNVNIDEELIYGVSLFGKPASEEEAGATVPAPEQVLELSPAMQKFTHRLVRNVPRPMDRARRLVNRLVRKEFFPDGYYTEDTRTASEVFELRSGNCLSYTNLFVAMARELGLTAHFQLARIPAAYSSDSGFLVRSRHINVLISDARVPSKDWLTVDFNKVATSALYPHTPVTDAFAFSSFYNNLAIDKLYAGDYETTVFLLAQAIEVEPNNADAWVNLAAVYSRHSRPLETQAAFEAALRAEPGNESALSGLARIYEMRGDNDQAMRYTNEIKTRRERDPYYQFAMAQAAYEQKAFGQSLDHINQAIELRERGAFYYLQALAHYAKGNLSAASVSLDRAQQHKRSLPSKKQEHVLAMASRIHAQEANKSLKGLANEDPNSLKTRPTDTPN